MKKAIILAILALGISSATFAHPHHHGHKAKKHTSAKVMYTCTMHPEVIKSKPGKCPKCGMALVKKETPTKK